ncbi:MAG: hypothetical protein QG591_91 [Planctomycetota bacterium]|nr:hypothetical protein [Planctomycetota bacterium]
MVIGFTIGIILAIPYTCHLARAIRRFALFGLHTRFTGYANLLLSKNLICIRSN